MNKVILAALALCVTTTGVFAANCGSPKATGFYAGLGAGLGLGKTKISLPSVLDLFKTTPTAKDATATNILGQLPDADVSGRMVQASLDVTNSKLKKTKGGAIFNLFGGYNHQLSNGFVIGAEGSFGIDTRKSKLGAIYTTGPVSIYTTGTTVTASTMTGEAFAAELAKGKVAILSPADAANLFNKLGTFPSIKTGLGAAVGFVPGDFAAPDTTSSFSYANASSFNVKRNFFFSFSGRMGYMLQSALVYARAGFDISRYKLKGNVAEAIALKGLADATGTALATPTSFDNTATPILTSFKKTKTSIQPHIGFGVDYFIGKFFVRGDYKYTFSNTGLKADVAPTGSLLNTLNPSASSKGKVKNDSHAITVSVGMKF